MAEVVAVEPLIPPGYRTCRLKVWTAKESKAAVKSMKGGRPKKSTRVVKRIKTRRDEPEWKAYSDVKIYGTLTKNGRTFQSQFIKKKRNRVQLNRRTRPHKKTTMPKTL